MINSNQRVAFHTFKDDAINQALKERLLQDYTNVRSIIYDPYQTIGYKYDPKLNLIALRVKKTQGKWSRTDKKTLIEDQISMDTIGPDTWMEGNIIILSRDEFPQLPYQYVELGLEVEKICLKGQKCPIEFTKEELQQFKLQSQLIAAIENKKLQKVRLLLKQHQIDLSVGGNLPFSLAVSYNQPSIVKMLLKMDQVDPAARNNQAIVIASMNGNVEIVKLLLADSRVDPSFDNNRALRLAMEKQHDKVVELLLSDSRLKLKNIDLKQLGDDYTQIRLITSRPNYSVKLANAETIVKAWLRN